MMVEVSGVIEIIYVEDNSDIADVTATFLERNDDRFTVETLPEAGAALDWFEQSRPDCVLSDYDMPGMDGIELLKRVRKEHPKLPFFLYTGKGNESVASSAISAGVTDYLQKETGLQQYELLANRISNAVTGYRAEQAAADRLHELQQTVKAVPAAVVRVDSDRTVAFANEQAESIFDIAPGDNINQQLADADWKPVDTNTMSGADTEPPFKRVFETGEPVEDVRCVMTRANGDPLTVVMNAAPVYDNEAVDSVVCAITDITGDTQQVQTAN